MAEDSKTQTRLVDVRALQTALELSGRKTRRMLEEAVLPKADASDTYRKAEVYTKQEVDALVASASLSASGVEVVEGDAAMEEKIASGSCVPGRLYVVTEQG